MLESKIKLPIIQNKWFLLKDTNQKKQKKKKLKILEKWEIEWPWERKTFPYLALTENTSAHLRPNSDP